MVRPGFMVMLVDAATLKPFRQVIQKDKQSFVQVQPNAEYFVRISSRGVPRFKAEVFVDGKSLGYRYRSSNDGECTKILGLRVVTESGRNNVQALKFRERMTDNPKGDDMTVRVDFYLVGSEWEMKDTAKESSASESKWTSVGSSVGSTVITTSATSVRSFSTGDFITSVALHYRTKKKMPQQILQQAKETINQGGLTPVSRSSLKSSNFKGNQAASTPKERVTFVENIPTTIRKKNTSTKKILEKEHNDSMYTIRGVGSLD